MVWLCAIGSYSRGRDVSYRSLPPKPSGRSDVKTNVKPSPDKAASESLNGPFTAFPRCCGTDQGAEGDLRVEIHRSRRPTPAMSGGAGRFESMITSRPSKRIVGRKSFCGVLSSVNQRRRSE